MRYSVLTHVQKHQDDRWTVAFVDPDAREATGHAASRELAEASLAEAIAARIEDPEDALGDRLRAGFTHEVLNATVLVRVRRASGRRREVPVSIQAALVRGESASGSERGDRGMPELVVPRLGLWLTLPLPEDARQVLEDEVRRELAGASEGDILALAPDGQEWIETLEVAAKPRERLRRKPKKLDALGPTLQEVGQDLCAEARRGHGAFAYEREAEVKALLEAIGASPPASVLLVGEPGVGKTAIVHEAARRIALKEAPETLEGVKVVALPASRIVAGMRYHGDWEERVKKIVEEAREKRVVLFVLDLAELCEAGQGEDGGGGVARFFAPHIERGEICLVAECTPERRRRVAELDPGLLSLFRKQQIDELAPASTLEVLRRLRGPLGRKHQVEIAESACEASLDLARRFVPARRLPGKAASVLARAAELAASKNQKDRVEIDASWVTAAFTHDTGLPEIVLRDDLPLDRSKLVAELEARVIDQPEAARALADAVLLVKTGLNDPKKPAAVYLFCGPTGTGKTESARVLAERLFSDASRLVRFDMSEYQDPLGALRLLGSEKAEGALPRRAREQPFAVVLLDEIEKAHESVFHGLLSLLGEGRLVDRGGRVADLRSSIVILTSNLGARDSGSIGFLKDGLVAQGERYRQAAEKFFRPELLNRIDRIVPFAPLSREAIEKIAQRELEAIVEREGLTRRSVKATFAPELTAELARAGYHPQWGARPLKREVERRVLVPLAEHLVRRASRGAESLEVYLDELGEVRIAVTESAPPKTLADEFPDLDSDLTHARAAFALSKVRVRVAEARELFLLRSKNTRETRVFDAFLREARADVRALEVEIEQARSAGVDLKSDVRERLTTIDQRLTRAEIELRVACSNVPPLASLELQEEKQGEIAGAAARWLAERLLTFCKEREIEATLAHERHLRLDFQKPEAARPLAVEAGRHEIGLDFPEVKLRGAIVRVGEGKDLVRRVGGTPVRHAHDLRTGLRLEGDLALREIERFLLARWRQV